MVCLQKGCPEFRGSNEKAYCAFDGLPIYLPKRCWTCRSFYVVQDDCVEWGTGGDLYKCKLQPEGCIPLYPIATAFPDYCEAYKVKPSLKRVRNCRRPFRKEYIENLTIPRRLLND